MIVLGLFLLYLAESAAAFVFFELLARWAGGATMTEAILMSVAVSGAIATLLILVANGRGGVIIAVAILAFWSVIIFGWPGATATNILTVAAAALVVAAVVVLVESFVVRWRAARNPP